MGWRDAEQQLNIIFSADCRVEDEKGRGERIWGELS
jgi:hypothetical protein